MIYDKIFEDASAVYLGAASAHGKGALILESTLHVAKEYIECMRPCSDAPACGKLSQAARKQLEALGAIRNGRVHPYGAEHILIRELGKSGADILFLTRVLSVRRFKGMYHIEALCLDTVKTFCCRVFYPARKSADNDCTFNILAQVQDAAKLPEDIAICPTVYNSLSILRIRAQSIQAARKRFAVMQGITIVHFPSELCPDSGKNETLFAALDCGERGEFPLPIEVERETPMLTQACCDVLVVGVGTAGSIAAIQAARSGHRIVAADRLPFIGGLSTSTVFQYYYGARGGLYEEVDAYGLKIAESGITACPTDENRINPTAMIIAYDRLFEKENISFLGKTFLASVFRKERQITGARLLTPEGFVDVSCKFLIDGTSENHACSLAGCAFHKGRSFDGKTQPFSYVTLLCDEKQLLPCMHSSDFGYTDAADPFDFSANILRSAEKVQLPKNQVHLGMSCSLGAREGRCIVGEAQLNWPDFFWEKPIDRPVTYGLSNMDDHGKDMAFESQMHADWMVGMSMWGTTVRLQVPMGALIPRELDNCVVASRNLDMDHDCASHMRMMRDLRRIGEAAGLIAALAIESDCAAREVDYEKLKKTLLQSGCMEELTEPDVWDTKPEGTPVLYPKDAAAAMRLMATSKPGLAMLYLLRKKKESLLLKYLSSDNSWLSFNCACVLALAGNGAGKAVLLSHLKQRDQTLLETSRKFNMTRGLTALYLLGRMGDSDIEAECRALWEEEGELTQYAVQSDEFFYRPEDTRFAYLSHATRALVTVAHVHPERKKEIYKFLRKKTGQKDFQTFYSLKSSRNIVYNGTEEIRKLVSTLAD
ncbi:MAG: FAD-dependent oxidoreductase [Christensenellales bacterium]|jgi:hypothetical protein